MQPLVSVIVPSYNKAHLTVKTIESLLRQTYQPLEIIVVDDGSTDDTLAQLKAYEGRITCIVKENGGACSARNRGIREAKGSYIGLLDCDDLYFPDKVELGVRFLEAHPKAAFVHTAAYFIDGQDTVVGKYSHPQSKKPMSFPAGELLKGNFICNSTVLARKDVLIKAGLFNETIFVPADWQMWLKMSLYGDIGFIDLPLTMYRVEGNYTFNRLELAYKEEEFVVDDFYRNHLSDKFLFRQAKANMHLRFAQCYLLKDNLNKMWSCLYEALKLVPWHLKAWVFLLLFILAKPLLVAQLHKRIIRYGSKPSVTD